MALAQRPFFNHPTQLLERCGAIRAAWKARQNQPNQPVAPPHLNAGPPNIPPPLAQQKPLPPPHPQPSYPNPLSHLRVRDPQSHQQQHPFSHAQAGVQGGPVQQVQPHMDTGLALPNGDIRYGPIQVSKWSKVTGPQVWGGMYR